MTQDKPNSVNLGGLVNAGVPTDFVLIYLSGDNITQEVLKLGKGCKFLKLISVGHCVSSLLILGIWIS